MNWPDERYVRLYTRETAEWRAFRWEAKALLPLLLMHADRTGLIAVRPGEARIRLVAGLTGLPIEIARPGLSDLLLDGCLVEVEAGFLFRNFIEAQEAEASDAKRAREYRERRRRDSMGGVTFRDGRSEDPRQSVTFCDETVTPSLAVPSVPKEEEEKEEEEKRPNGAHAPSVASLQSLWNQLADPALPRWMETGAARARRGRLALKGRPIAGENSWTAVILRINASPFCLGDNDRGWRASPDWLLQPDTASKVLEGKYDAKRAKDWREDFTLAGTGDTHGTDQSRR